MPNVRSFSPATATSSPSGTATPSATPSGVRGLQSQGLPVIVGMAGAGNVALAFSVLTFDFVQHIMFTFFHITIATLFVSLQGPHKGVLPP